MFIIKNHFQHRKTLGLFVLSGLLSLISEHWANPLNCNFSPNLFLNKWCSMTDFYVLQTTEQIGVLTNEAPFLDVSFSYTPYFYSLFWLLLSQGLLFHLPSLTWKLIKRELKANNTLFNIFFFLNHIFLLSINLAQLLLANAYFQNEFYNLGPNIILHLFKPKEERYDYLSKLLPQVAFCKSPTSEHFLCILPFNAYNEKIIVFLWFYLTLLFLVNFAIFVYYLTATRWKRLRTVLLETDHKSTLNFAEWIIRTELSTEERSGFDPRL